jgi:hypothetical protein
MELQVEVTKVATSIDYFFKVRFDINEVGLVEQYAMTAAGCSTLRVLEVLAFGFESFLGVKSLFFKDNLHSFEPTWHTWMVLVEMEGLNSPVESHILAPFDQDVQLSFGLFTILWALRALGAHFWWVVMLSKMNKVCLNL